MQPYNVFSFKGNVMVNFLYSWRFVSTSPKAMQVWDPVGTLLRQPDEGFQLPRPVCGKEVSIAGQPLAAPGARP